MSLVFSGAQKKNLKRNEKNEVMMDPFRMQDSMDQMMSNMMLPIAFFIFCRKILGQIVLEKERGMLEYLMMNGMSQTAYNISFILHEMFVNGPIIVVILDGIVWYRVDPEYVKWNELFLFNLSIILFIGGVVSIALLISKGFNSPGFAI